ncbi:MAG: hypothetical protein WCF94_03175 [bacterium]
MYANNKMSWWLYMIGLVMVFGSHIYMLAVGVPQSQMMAHAGFNILAGVLLMMGWLSRKA